jgi:diguanylate cyclase (GGDEF)-like protein
MSMGLDLTTLLIVSQLVSAVCGLLFAIEAVQGRSSTSWWFAGGFLCAPLASLFYIGAACFPQQFWWGYPLGNAVATATMGLTWLGARATHGQSTPYWVVLVVPIAILAGVLAFDTTRDAWSGALPFFLSFGSFSGLAALAFYREEGGERRLRNSTILSVICTCDALLYFGRALGLVILGKDSPFFLTVLGPEVSAMVLLVLIVIASFSLMALAKERALLAMEHAAAHDSLTDLLNRRAFFLRAETEMRRLAKDRGAVSVLLLDLDHFKNINDTCGHACGDRVLVSLARVARESLRSSDIICRYGGEEFAAVLPDTSVDDAFRIAERLRMRLSQCTNPALTPLKPTASIGIASAMAEAMTLEELLERADKCLYTAKITGRDRTVTERQALAA